MHWHIIKASRAGLRTATRKPAITDETRQRAGFLIHKTRKEKEMSEQNVIEKIQQSDFYRGLIEQEKSELVEKRKAAAKALASIDKDTDTRTRDLIKTIAAAEKTASEIEKEAQEARARVDALKAERFGLGSKAEAQKRAQQDFLIESADPRINQAIVWFSDNFDALRRGTADRQSYAGKFDPLSWTREISSVSNHQARVEALRYCRAAIQKLQAMKLQAEVDQKALQELATNMPDPANDFSETSGRKTEKDFADVPYWARFPSDAQHRADMADLLERADNLRRKRTA